MSPFEGILSGREACERLVENDRYLAFLERKPLKEGHTVVIPKREEDFLFDLSDEELAGLFVFAKPVALALRRALPCKKVGVAVIGLEVRHAHVHLVPIDAGAELNFTLPRLEPEAAKLRETADRIRSALL